MNTYRIRIRNRYGYDDHYIDAPDPVAALEDPAVASRPAFSLMGLWVLTAGTWAAGTWERIDWRAL